MKFRSLVAVAATALFVATGYAAAATIGILQVSKHGDGSSSLPAPAGFTLLDLGTGTANSLQTTLPFTVGGVTFSFAGGGSREYAGGGAVSSPFGGLNATKNFVAAGGGGTVDVTWATVQNELYVLWGTVDPEPGRNVITMGAIAIDGAAIMAAIINQGFTYDDHLTNTYLRITGLPNFTSATVSDAVAGNFEFVLGTTPSSKLWNS
jgi:hypothetical protein